MNTRLRLAVPGDAAAVRAIYAPHCLGSAATFETEVPPVAEMQARIERLAARYPWLVLELSGAVCAYAYAGPHNARAAYDWSVNVSVYVAAGHQGRGHGRALYTALLQVLRLQGFHQACALIAMPNPASIALHAGLGFRSVGVYTGIGYKLGAWRDVAHYQLQLQATPGTPAITRTPAELAGSREWQDALRPASAGLS